MHKQLTATQIAQLKVLLEPLGLNITKARKPRVKDDYLARVKAWKPETAAGRACKSSMLYWASLPPVRDYSKPCVDTLLRFFGYRGVGANELGGYNPKGLWIASIAKAYAKPLAYCPGENGAFCNAAIQTKITTTKGMRSFREMNVGVFPRTDCSQHA